ncbi:MAG TPA: hypothetical protein VM389_11440 [Phycisphaerae bacterium]|nr:hypothetical protein [Phycisphaerae bacterium]
MPFFVGEFKQTIDAKHRMVIPMGLRERMDPEKDGKQFLLVLAEDGHLWLYPDKAYRRVLERLDPSKLPDREAGENRLVFATARVVKPDKQGRVVLPEESIERGKLSPSVTLVGVFDHIEVWPRDEWEQHLAERLPEYGEVLARAAKKLRDRTTASE